MDEVASVQKRTTIHDVAEAAGVSVSTVSKALNGSGRMNAETRKRVVRTAKDLAFRPSAMARGLLAQRSFTVGLLTNDVHGRFTLPIASGVTEALADQNVSVFLCPIEDNPDLAERYLGAMLDKQVDGIIIAGRQVDFPLPVDLSQLPVPVVYVMSNPDPDGISFVNDDYHGGKLATEHLLDLGRKRLVHISGPESFVSARDRADAFFDIMGPNADVMFGEWSENWGYEAVRHIWNQPELKPDGIFCGNDQIARGVLGAMRDLRVDVPDDVAVIGFDNWEVISAFTRPPLSTVDIGLKKLGKEAGLAMLSLTNGEAVEAGVRRLPCKLVKRQSCEWNPSDEDS